MRKKGFNPLGFKQFAKGRKELGGIVESSAKQVKKLLFGSYEKNVLNYIDFEFYVDQTISPLNKRPVKFKEMLRDTSADKLFSVLTPEMIVKGYDLPCVNVITSMEDTSLDPDWYSSVVSVKDIDSKWQALSRVGKKLIDLYNEEFRTSLIAQATDMSGRYKLGSASQLKIGDIVLMREDNMKRADFPMVRIVDLHYNFLYEVNKVFLIKGASRE